MSKQTSVDRELINQLSITLEQGIKYCYDDTYIIDATKLIDDPIVVTQLNRPIYVNKMLPEIGMLNSMTVGEKIKEKVEFDIDNLKSEQWNIPTQYQTMTMSDIIDRLMDNQEQYNFTDLNVRYDRIEYELQRYKTDDKINVLQLMFYIVDTLTQRGQVWGVGRGSSVASYVLFLIGVHDIDSVKYGLDFDEFLVIKKDP